MISEKCENCEKTTDQTKMVWVGVRTYEDMTAQKWCHTCKTKYTGGLMAIVISELV